MKPLQEGGLNRILKHSNANEMCFISACRSENTHQENVAKTKALRQDLRELDYGFMPIWGAYIENKGTPKEEEVLEMSVVVINPKGRDYNSNFANDMFKLCNKYHQECILLKASGYKTALYDGERKRQSGYLSNITLSDFEDAFTMTHGRKFALVAQPVGIPNDKHRPTWAEKVKRIWEEKALEEGIYDWEHEE